MVKKVGIILLCLVVGLFLFGMRSFYNKTMTTQVHTLSINDDSSDVTTADKFVTFPETFKTAPAVLVVPPLGVEGTWTAGTITTTTCSISVDTCTDLQGVDFEVVVVAHEKL